MRYFCLILCFCPFLLLAQNSCTITACPDTFICVGGSVTLQTTGLSNPVWSPASGLSCTTCTSPVATPAVTTTYTVVASQMVNAAVNGDFSQGLNGFTSSYFLDNVSLINEGTYTVNTNPNNVHPGWSAYGDHTTGSGNYLIVNGAGTPGVDVWCETVTIPPNTNFTFSCWGINLCNPPAMLQFSINGVPQGGTFSVSSTVGVWTQYSATWNSGNNTTVTICIMNMNTVLLGNDFGLDDIEFTYLCTDTDYVQVEVYPLPVPNFSVTQNTGCDTVCPVFTDLSSAAPPQQIVSWQWDLGDNTSSALQQPSHCYSSPGTYDIGLTVETDKGCQATLILNDTVTVYPPPQAAFTSDITEASLIDPVFNFTDQSLNALNWAWSFGDPAGGTSTQQNPSYTYSDAGEYDVCLLVTGPGGCTDTVCSEVIVVDDEWTLYVPNCFTPNNDGLNDIFMAKGENIVEFNIKIFDRWGELIFESNDINHGWNGIPEGKTLIAQEDVYVFKIKATGCDDTRRVIYGHVSLIR